MKAYKFRSSSQLPFALDIIFNSRLYCADWQNLNDPMEGIFCYSYNASEGKGYEEKVVQIIEHTKRFKLCSLSKTFDSHLLWAHYASGFAGLAIEVELPDQSSVIKSVEYRGVFASVTFDKPSPEDRIAEDILSSKYQEWSYEQEVRVLQQHEWYKLPKPVSHVIVGHRMNPALLDALRIICEHRSIRLSRTGIGDMGIDADPVPPLSI